MQVGLGPRAPPHHALVVAGLVSSLVLVLAAVLPPYGLPFGTCALRSLLGLPCPTCGATRTFVHLAHGRVAEALSLSPGAALLFLLAVVVLLFGVARATVLRRRVEVTLSPLEWSRVRAGAWIALAVHWTWLVVHGVA